jgi:hypothetical protein
MEHGLVQTRIILFFLVVFWVFQTWGVQSYVTSNQLLQIPGSYFQQSGRLFASAGAALWSELGFPGSAGLF